MPATILLAIGLTDFIWIVVGLLLLFTGQLSPTALLNSDDQGEPLTNATVGYGVGNWYALTDRPEEADRVWRTVLSGTQWSAFGYIAAEAEIARVDTPR